MIILDDSSIYEMNYNGQTYKLNSFKNIDVESFDNLVINDEPMTYIYKISVRKSELPVKAVYLPNKNLLFLHSNS